jgi:hypothetical protein
VELMVVVGWRLWNGDCGTGAVGREIAGRDGCKREQRLCRRLHSVRSGGCGTAAVEWWLQYAVGLWNGGCDLSGCGTCRDAKNERQSWQRAEAIVEAEADEAAVDNDCGGGETGPAVEAATMEWAWPLRCVGGRVGVDGKAAAARDDAMASDMERYRVE